MRHTYLAGMVARSMEQGLPTDRLKPSKKWGSSIIDLFYTEIEEDIRSGKIRIDENDKIKDTTTYAKLILKTL